MSLESQRQNVVEAAAFLAAMGNNTRLTILRRLMSGDKSFGALSQGQGISKQAVSQHLHVLRECDLVKLRRPPQVYSISLEATKVVVLLERLFDLGNSAGQE